MKSFEKVKKIFYKGLKIQADLKEKGMSLTYQTMSEDMARLTCQLFPKTKENPDGYEPEEETPMQHLTEEMRLGMYHGEPKSEGRLLTEENAIANIIRSARTIQEYLWGDVNRQFGFEEWRRMFRKRVAKLDTIDSSNPYAMTELKKRVLQVGALAVALLAILEKEKTLPEHKSNEPPSNLPGYKKKPGEGGLLTITEDAELREKWRKLPEETRPSWRNHWLQAQRDLTRKECQARVEGIFREIDRESYLDPQTGYRWLYPSDWQALKEKEQLRSD